MAASRNGAQHGARQRPGSYSAIRRAISLQRRRRRRAGSVGRRRRSMRRSPPRRSIPAIRRSLLRRWRHQHAVHELRGRRRHAEARICRADRGEPGPTGRSIAAHRVWARARRQAIRRGRISSSSACRTQRASSLRPAGIGTTRRPVFRHDRRFHPANDFAAGRERGKRARLKEGQDIVLTALQSPLQRTRGRQRRHRNGESARAANRVRRECASAQRGQRNARRADEDLRAR